MKVSRSAALLLAVYTAPLVVYVLVFGPLLSTDHDRWGEFGSAMAGIYAPIVALSTLALLVRQTRLQSQINEHQYDQAYIGQARSDIDFYAVQLAEILKAHVIPGVTVRQHVQQHFQLPRLEDLDEEDRRRLAADMDSITPQVLGMWMAIYPIFVGLQTKKSAVFDMTLQSSIQRLVALLSFETCVCLENFHRIRTKGRLKVPYKFSPLLTEDSVTRQPVK